MQKIVRTAGFGADAGKFQTPERLALDDGAGDTAVDIKIADVKFPARFFDVRRRPRENAAGQSEGGIVGNVQRLIEGFSVDDRQDRAKNLFLGNPAFRRDVTENRRPDEVSLCWRSHFQRALGFLLADSNIFRDALLGFGFDHRADGIARIFRRADL